MAMLPDMSQIPAEEFLRIIETLMSRPPPPPRQDPIARVFELAEDTFRRVLRQHQGPPQLERVTWWRLVERAEVRFEASFSRPELSWCWSVDTARLYSERGFIDELERSDLRRRLQEMWRTMVDEHMRQRLAGRERDALQRLTLRATVPNPPIVYGADFAGAGDELAVFGTTPFDVGRTFTIDRRELVEARDMTATEVQARYADAARAYQRRVDEGLYRDMFGGPCRCDDCRGSRSPARRGAEARGEKLLREWLSPAQRAQYDLNRNFDVIGGSSGKRYRIEPRPSYNIVEVGADNVVEALWCFLPAGNLVQGDIMLAQKVALETNERDALKVANHRLLRGDSPGSIYWMGRTGTFENARWDEIRPGMIPRDFVVGEWREETGRQPDPAPRVRRAPRQPEVPSRSWMAGWGDLGRDLAAEAQGLTSRAARRARRRS